MRSFEFSNVKILLSSIKVGVDILELVMLVLKLAPFTDRERRNVRKRQVTPDWYVSGSVSKKTHIPAYLGWL